LDPSVTLEAGTHVGKYVVRRKLAEGGMAEIFLCTARGPEGFEKEVVIKRVRSFLASDPDFVQMFIAEARLASRLNHANVVQIFDFDKHEDTYYLAMEYVRGCSLWELRKRTKEAMTPLPPVLVAHIGAEVARGLHYAHRLRVNGELLNLVHRDVTPHNVLVSYDGAVKLTDFGIAKAGNKLTNPGVLKGKFAYMSPEQARGEAVDVRTDVFALGVVLWELLTGGRLFQGDSEIAVLRAVQESAIAPPARLNPDVPPELDEAIRRALERDVTKRFQTAGELERALAQCVLKHAKSVDDTDVGAFMRALFPVAASSHSLPALPERTALVDGAFAAPSDAPAPREPTAVMASREHASGSARAPGPDENLHGTTLVLSRDDAGPARPPQPTPRMAQPSLGRGADAPVAGRTPSREVAGVEAPSAGALAEGSQSRGRAPSRDDLSVSASGARGAEVETVSATEPGPPVPMGRKRALWAGAAALGLAGVLAVVAVSRSQSGTPAAQGSAPPSTATAPSSPGTSPPAVTGTPSPAPERPSAEAPDAELEGQRREAALETPPPAAAPSEKASPAEGTAGTPAAEEAKVLGSLQVKAFPYATVFLGSKRLGDVQGRMTYKVQAGTYSLTFQHPSGSKTFTVVVPPNGSVTQEFRVSRGR
jgi:eukaryotic-like serine/threonine-protein kinase